MIKDIISGSHITLHHIKSNQNRSNQIKSNLIKSNQITTQSGEWLGKKIVWIFQCWNGWFNFHYHGCYFNEILVFPFWNKKKILVGNGRMVSFPSYIPWLNHLISFVVFSCCVVFAQKKLNHYIHLCRRIALHYKFHSFKMDCHWDIFFCFHSI